jgi:hypothetical protein
VCDLAAHKKSRQGSWRLFWGRNSLRTTLPFLRQRHWKSKKVKIKMAGSGVHGIDTSRPFAAEQPRILWFFRAWVNP